MSPSHFPFAIVRTFLPIHLLLFGLAVAEEVVPDARHISRGWVIPSEGYADQPYIVRTDDKAWLCVMTTGKGSEGEPGQHIVACRSTDQGRTWSPPIDVEPAKGPEASYAVLLKATTGRIYCFYNHNTDRVREVKREDKGAYKRVDSLGHYVFKYSDDHGQTWSAERYDVPVREFECDRNNVYQGKLRFFWNVGRPVTDQIGAWLVLHKVGAMGEGFFAQSEGCFLRSDNILTESDPRAIRFETLPEGEVGLRAPDGGGRVAEEQSLVRLDDGSLYCVYRTVDGWPVSSMSRDSGRTWSAPEYARYRLGGRRFKHPRAANFVWRCNNGRYLYWFHNHGGSPAKQRKDWNPYDDRNPAWLSAGIERDSSDGRIIEWSEPEVVLYADDPFIRMSYPDLIEDDGRYFVTETQKNVARVHEISADLVTDLFNQGTHQSVASGMIKGRSTLVKKPTTEPMPRLPEFHVRDQRSPDYRGKDLRAGFSIEMRLNLDKVNAGDILLDSRDQRGKGIAILVTGQAGLELVMNDGRTECRWASDPETLSAASNHHIVITVDGGPKIMTFVVDGVLQDGGDHRQFGWGRFSPHFRAPNPESDRDGNTLVRLAPRLAGTILEWGLYSRPLRTSQAVGNYRASIARSR